MIIEGHNHSTHLLPHDVQLESSKNFGVHLLPEALVQLHQNLQVLDVHIVVPRLRFEEPIYVA